MATPARSVTSHGPSFEAQLPEYARQSYRPHPEAERRGGLRLHRPESVRMVALDLGNKGENEKKVEAFGVARNRDETSHSTRCSPGPGGGCFQVWLGPGDVQRFQATYRAGRRCDRERTRCRSFRPRLLVNRHEEVNLCASSIFFHQYLTPHQTPRPPILFHVPSPPPAFKVLQCQSRRGCPSCCRDERRVVCQMGHEASTGHSSSQRQPRLVKLQMLHSLHGLWDNLAAARMDTNLTQRATKPPS